MTANGCRAAGARPIVLALDWNGTFVDDCPRALYATQIVLEHFGLPPLDGPTFSDRFRLPLRRFFADLGVPRQGRDEAETRWNEVMVDGSPPPLVRGATALLDAANRLDLRTGVLSAAAEPVVRRDLDRLDLEDRFDFVVGGVSSKRDALAAIAAFSGSRVIYVGDTEHDVEEARRAGQRAIAFGGGYRPIAALRNARPDWAVETLEEIPLILEGLLT